MDGSISNLKSSPSEAASSGRIPLVVDLEGALINCDLRGEAFFAILGRGPAAALALAGAALRGKAVLSAFLAEHVKPDPATLPYNPAALAPHSIRQAGGPAGLHHLRTG